MGSSSSTSAVMAAVRALPPGLSRAEFASRVGLKIYMAKYYGRKVGYVFRDTRPERSGQSRRGPETVQALASMANRGKTLKEAGEELGGVTRERARQIYNARGVDRSGVAAVRAAAKIRRQQDLADRLKPLLEEPDAWRTPWPDLASRLGLNGNPKKTGAKLAGLAHLFGLAKPTLASILPAKLVEGVSWCQTYQAWKPVDNFYRCTRRPNGLQARCKSCLKAAQTGCK